MILRKCSLSELYALLESERVLAHVEVSGLLNKRNACKHGIVSQAPVLNIQDLLPSNKLTEVQSHKDYSSPHLLSQS